MSSVLSFYKSKSQLILIYPYLGFEKCFVSPHKRTICETPVDCAYPFFGLPGVYRFINPVEQEIRVVGMYNNCHFCFIVRSYNFLWLVLPIHGGAVDFLPVRN